MRYCKDITNLIFWELWKCLTIPIKIILSICSKPSCLSACKKSTSLLNPFLRYYATLKVRKFESLFYKINTCLQKTATYFGLRVEKIFSVNIYTYFSILGVDFTVLCLCYIKKLQLLVVKKFWTMICCIILLYLWAQKVCLRFLKSYFKLEILIFLSVVVSFLVDMFN